MWGKLGKKVSVIFMLIFFVSLLFISLIYPSTKAKQSPIILDYTVFPKKVQPGDSLKVTVEFEDEEDVEGYTIFQHEKGEDRVPMILTRGTTKKGVYTAVWQAHDTIEKEYSVNSYLTDSTNITTTVMQTFHDPEVSHTYEEIIDRAFASVHIQDGSVNIVDTNGSVQQRITGTCASGSAIRQISGAAVVCDTDDYGTGTWSCTDRTNAGSGAVTASCTGGESLVGCGCDGGAAILEDFYPSGNSCICEAISGGAVTTYAICCTLT